MNVQEAFNAIEKNDVNVTVVAPYIKVLKNIKVDLSGKHALTNVIVKDLDHDVD